MRSRIPLRPHRTAGRLALLAVLVSAGLALAPGAAAWAAGLTGSDPADGVALATAPRAVMLTFSGSPDPELSHVSARDSSGAAVSGGEVFRAGSTALRLPVAIRSAGDYTVAYHVVFADGTDVIGMLRFSVGTGTPPASLDAGAAVRARQLVTTGHDHGVDPLSASLLVADAMVLVGVVLLLLRRPPPQVRSTP